MSTFKRYRRIQIAELRPYVKGEVLSERVSISASDIEAGSPKAGDMIARNPDNHEDQWLVAQKYFEQNFERLDWTLHKHFPSIIFLPILNRRRPPKLLLKISILIIGYRVGFELYYV